LAPQDGWLRRAMRAFSDPALRSALHLADCTQARCFAV
jgi:hypothetical protein